MLLPTEPSHQPETNPFLKIQEDTIKQVKKIDQSSPIPKNGSKNNKENTNGGNSGNGKTRKQVRNYRIQETEERISGIEDTIEYTDTTVVKENTKHKKL